MGYSERKELYKQIEEIRGRPLLAYVTSGRVGLGGGKIANDVLPEFCEQILTIPKDQEEIDLFIVSNGGDPLVSWRIMSFLRQQFKVIGALLPYQAFSAATLLALGANEIIMHPFSNMGPVDPQVSITKKEGNELKTIDFAVEDLSAFISFLNEDLDIKTEEQRMRAFAHVFKDINPINIGSAKRVSSLTLQLGEQFLKLHMTDHDQVSKISEKFNKSFYHHGYPIGRQEATEAGLPVSEDIDETIYDLMWSLWKDFESEMQCNVPFNAVPFLLGDEKAKQQLSVPTLNIPGNTPPEVVKKIYDGFLQNIQIQRIEPVKCSVLNASLESHRLSSEFVTELMIQSHYGADMKLNINVTPISSGWRREPSSQKRR